MFPPQATDIMTRPKAKSTFISTVISGGLYTVLLFVFVKAQPEAMVGYVPIVLGTATLNAIIVGALYVPLMKVLKKEIPVTKKAEPVEEEKAE